MSAVSEAARAEVREGQAAAQHSVPRRPVVRARTLFNVLWVELGIAALVWALLDLRWAFHYGALGFDFAGTLWDPGHAILSGASPYPPALEAEVDVGNPAYYPPLLMLLVAPLTYLPWSVGAVVWTALLVAATLGALYALDVRDLRCYALALVSAPVVHGVMWGNATLLLVCLVAFVWRWRAHRYRSAALLGVGIAAKLFLWPLIFWQLGARRYRAATLTMAVAAVGVLLPWAAIGFDGFRTYPDLLRVAQNIYASHGLSVATMLGALGLETEPATWGGLAMGLSVGVLAFVAGRQGREATSFSLAVVAALVASPIVWEHYFAFLLIPLALARPRFSLLWLTLPLFQIALRLPAHKLEDEAAEPGGVACCPPDDAPLPAWLVSHSPPALWPALGHAALVLLIALAVWRTPPRRPGLTPTIGEPAIAEAGS